jgi:co-chaperonin GroES (HSP10)
MSFKPMRRDLLCIQLEPERRSKGGIELLSMEGPYSRMTVIARGRDVHPDIEVGDTVWVNGYRSGIKIEDDLYLISDRICEAKEEE